MVVRMCKIDESSALVEKGYDGCYWLDSKGWLDEDKVPLLNHLLREKLLEHCTRVSLEIEARNINCLQNSPVYQKTFDKILDAFRDQQTGRNVPLDKTFESRERAKCLRFHYKALKNMLQLRVIFIFIVFGMAHLLRFYQQQQLGKLWKWRRVHVRIWRTWLPIFVLNGCHFAAGRAAISS